MKSKSTAPSAEAGAAAPADTAQQPNPLLTPMRKRDELTGKGGQYVRDPDTGLRTLVQPPAPPVPPPAEQA